MSGIYSQYMSIKGTVHLVDFKIRNIEKLSYIDKLQSIKLMDVGNNSEEVKKLNCEIKFIDTKHPISQVMSFELFNLLLGGIENKKINNRSSLKLSEDREITREAKIAAETQLQILEQINNITTLYTIHPGLYSPPNFNINLSRV